MLSRWIVRDRTPGPVAHTSLHAQRHDLTSSAGACVLDGVGCSAFTSSFVDGLGLSPLAADLRGAIVDPVKVAK